METRSNYVMVGAVPAALLVGVLLFIVWLAGLSNKQTKCFDIYFAQGVSGLNKGSNVTFSGVPVGTIQQISLLPSRPEFVWVRIEVDEQTPVLQGTCSRCCRSSARPPGRTSPARARPALARGRGRSRARPARRGHV